MVFLGMLRMVTGQESPGHPPSGHLPKHIYPKDKVGYNKRMPYQIRFKIQISNSDFRQLQVMSGHWKLICDGCP